eukprot:5556524-Pleurochrysis_carterae.AAC.1
MQRLSFQGPVELLGLDNVVFFNAASIFSNLAVALRSAVASQLVGEARVLPRRAGLPRTRVSPTGHHQSALHHRHLLAQLAAAARDPRQALPHDVARAGESTRACDPSPTAP